MKKRLLPIVGCLALLPLASCGNGMVNVLKGKYEPKFDSAEYFLGWTGSDSLDALYYFDIVKETEILEDDILYTYSSSFKEASEQIEEQFDYSKFKMSCDFEYDLENYLPTLKFEVKVAGDCKNENIGLGHFNLYMTATYNDFMRPCVFGNTGETSGRCAYAMKDCWAYVIRPNNSEYFNVEVSAKGKFEYHDEEISIDKTEQYVGNDLKNQITYTENTQAMYVFYYTFAYLPQISLLKNPIDTTQYPNRLCFGTHYFKNAPYKPNN